MKIRTKHILLAFILIIFLISLTNIVFAYANDDISIKACLISTPSLNEKTFARIYVGEDHSNEKVKIQIFYERNEKKLNPGNKVKKKVDNTGCINVSSAAPLKKYPDYARLNLYNSKGNELLDSKFVKLDINDERQIFYAPNITTSYSNKKVKSSTSNNNYNSRTQRTYIGNRNTGKFHYPGCRSVSRMKSSNKVYLSSRQEAVNRGYSSCAICNP